MVYVISACSLGKSFNLLNIVLTHGFRAKKGALCAHLSRVHKLLTLKTVGTEIVNKAYLSAAVLLLYVISSDFQEVRKSSGLTTYKEGFIEPHTHTPLLVIRAGFGRIPQYLFLKDERR